MAKRAKRHKWLLCCMLIVLVAALVIVGRGNVRDLPTDVEDNETASQENWRDFARNADALAADKEYYADGEHNGRETVIERPPRWGQQDVMPDIFQPLTGVPHMPQETRESPKVTAAEAQLTLQMFLGKLTWQEKMMVVKMLTKFSPSEMLEVFQLYKQGSRQAYRNLDAIVMAKISEADFEKLRALVDKYR